MSNSQQKRIIIVIGPGRSGTSAITRGLKVLGVDLGDNLMEPMTKVNEKGFWEDIDIYNLNNDIYKALNHEWSKLTPVSFNELSGCVYNNLKSRAINLIQNKLNSTNCFGFKDPQITRLLPFWQDIFSLLKLQVNYVIACRNPVSVANSMSRYTGFSLEKCYHLWFEFSLSSLIYTARKDRIVINYDQIITDPINQLQRIADRFGIQFDRKSKEVDVYKFDFLESNLRHHQFGEEVLQSNVMISNDTKSLYKLLIKLASDSLKVNDPEVVSLVAQIYKRHYANIATLRYLQLCEERASDCILRLNENNHVITSLNHKLEERNQQVLSINKALQVANNDLVERTKELVETRQTLEERTLMLEKTSNDLIERTKELVETRQTLEERTLMLENTINNL